MTTISRDFTTCTKRKHGVHCHAGNLRKPPAAVLHKGEYICLASTLHTFAMQNVPPGGSIEDHSSTVLQEKGMRVGSC